MLSPESSLQFGPEKRNVSVLYWAQTSRHPKAQNPSHNISFQSTNAVVKALMHSLHLLHPPPPPNLFPFKSNSKKSPKPWNHTLQLCSKTHKSLPFIKGGQQEILDLGTDPQASGVQIQSFVDAIKSLPSKEKVHNVVSGGIQSISDLNHLLMALFTTNELEIAVNLYSNLSSYSLVPDSETFSIMVRCHCKNNDGDAAKRVLDDMMETGVNPNVATFTSLIDTFCKLGQLKKAFTVFGVMDSVGCSPTIQTYNCLLKGLCYVGRVEEAFELLQDIKKTPLNPDIYTYTAMMDGFCKVGRSDEAMELLDEALQRGLTPNVVTFNTLFTGYTKEGRPVKGVGLFKKMKQRICMPDLISYRTLLHGLLIWGKIKTAIPIYKEMVENGFEVDGRLMNNLVRGLCRKSLEGNNNDLLEDACQVFEEMKKRSSIVDQSTYCLLIQALCMAKKGDGAFACLQQMIKSRYIPRLVTINSVIRALCTEAKVDEAVSILILMYENYKFPSQLSYDLLIHELNRQGRSLAACSVYGTALVRGVSPQRKPRR